MNWVGVFLIIVIGFTIFEGIYRGFLHSIINLGTFFLSVFSSFLLYPVIASAVKANDTIYNFLVYYTEGAEKIAVFSDSNLLISGMAQGKLDSIIADSGLSEPFATLIEQNVAASAFADIGKTTIGEYFNMTIVFAVLNILSFLAMFLIAYIIFTFVLGLVNYTVKFPELKQYDRSSGAAFGALRGFLLCFLIITVVPVIFLLLPVNQLSDYFANSTLGM
ncbi:MAG: CvpA family protein, partial [Clostridia bacterium]|nr:CvpA family protein [Clostridia bacterium]